MKRAFECTKEQLLAWAARYEYAFVFDSNDYALDRFSKYEFLVAVGDESSRIPLGDTVFAELATAHRLQPSWMFGCLSYDLKNQIYDLNSSNSKSIDVPLACWIRPQIVLKWENCQATILEGDISASVIQNTVLETEDPIQAQFSQSTSKLDYLKAIDALLNHIAQGDIYEANYCYEIFADQKIDPVSVFQELNQQASAPMSAFVKLRHQYINCMSPERFLAIRDRQIYSQPIKGTAKRHEDQAADQAAQRALRMSEKDRAEHIMIVDLVRNDLNRSCKAGTVSVDDLFRVYEFKTVWHMISTISGELEPDVHPFLAMKAAFPMGSMTGAPKVRAMQLIEEYESFCRGMYSGSIAYITPDGDLDSNVVIRSLIHDSLTHKSSVAVGGAIVADSIALQEYAECLTKAGFIPTFFE